LYQNYQNLLIGFQVTVEIVRDAFLGHSVESCKEEWDLGVWITDHLKWSLQCSKAASKAMKALGTIRRTFGSLSREGFQILYGTYVRPHLEYCTQV